MLRNRCEFVRVSRTGILDGCGEEDEATLVAAGEENPLASLKPTFDLPSHRRFVADLRTWRSTDCRPH
ncbi:hypothetical protein PCAR4_170104 [Paraburkholderia caribensis]|nr:hypothetical protein PCAR4_170104 [Paraburkholderia caribensis]